MKISKNVLAFTLLAVNAVVKASELGGEDCEPLTGLFDYIPEPLTVDSILNFTSSSAYRVLVYGMKVKPSVEVINYALNHGMADVNAFDGYGRCSLSYALDNNDFDAAEALVRHGADVNAFTFNTVLVLIARDGNFEGVQFLLKHGADRNLTGKSGVTVLSAAAESGNLELVKLLVESGCDVNQTSRNRSTPLMMASESHSQNTEVIEFLIESGARITDTDSYGENALFYAIRKREFESFARLLRLGGIALVNNANSANETIFDYIWNESNRKIVRALIEKYN